MESSTAGAACPECGEHGTISMYAIKGGRFEFEFVCPRGHKLVGAPARELWIGAHR